MIPTEEDVMKVFDAGFGILQEVVEAVGIFDTYQKPEYLADAQMLLNDLAPTIGKMLVMKRTMQIAPDSFDDESRSIVISLCHLMYRHKPASDLLHQRVIECLAESQVK